MPNETIEGQENNITEKPSELHKPDETEVKARRLGWVGKDEFRGDAERWVTADRFVERGENELPLLQNDIRRLHDSNANLTNEITGMKITFKEFSEYHKQTETRAYDRAKGELEQDRREAAEKGDLVTYDQKTKEIDQISPPVTSDKTNEGNQTQTDTNPLYNAWHPNNGWYGDDYSMTIFADQVFAIAGGKGLQGKELYDEVTKEVKKQYPENFSNSARNEPEEKGNSLGPQTGGSKGYSDMDEEARSNCDRFVKEGLMKQDQYVKDYWAQGI